MTGNPPLVLHIIFRLATGGLENGLVNLVNRMPADRYRHAIVCLTHSSDFADRIRRQDIPVLELHKRPGKDLGVYRRLWKALRGLNPDIVHTRNAGTLDCMLPAWVSGVRFRIHGEHGREISDIEGNDKKGIWLRRAHRPFVNKFVAVSKDLQGWLIRDVGIQADKVVQIYNGVDGTRFTPCGDARHTLPLAGFAAPGDFVIGAVGRLDPVKDHATLLQSVSDLLRRHPTRAARIRLVVVGGGPMLQEHERFVAEHGLHRHVWFAGDRGDVANLLHCFDIFVQPSLAEGISNTVLEAMACGLPVIASEVGGNVELVEEGVSGRLVPKQDAEALSRAMEAYLLEPGLIEAHGREGRRRMEQQFSLDAMVDGYLNLYDGLMARSVH